MYKSTARWRHCTIYSNFTKCGAYGKQMLMARPEESRQSPAISQLRTNYIRGAYYYLNTFTDKYTFYLPEVFIS